ncbi:hypothetical protein FisN_2Hu142 [Fistulifera solaris]|uniref:Uncharacterized protein n=1 Tax=Fistulifera solaris TaxID=1519565 RepID=A0A1Z5KNY4_FISSO|nr:hypothetical protein FisN_2Hu142 [Fistulifera solaris]|eukprot:GAX28040.1 hypothetical protein FisN_2Hu142 [Fistulifera solaris]
MMWTPVPDIQQAWVNTKTIGGKISVILFYLLVLYFMLSASWSIFFPYQECLMAGIGGNDNPIAVAAVRAAYVFSVGFFIYALVGGYRIFNVIMVAVFLLADMIIWTSVAKEMDQLGCHDDMVGLYVFCAGAVLALVLALLDDKLGDRNAGAESLPLNV